MRPPEARAEPTGAFAPLQSSAYRYLFVGTALTMTGNFMQQVAQGWLVYDLTDSPTWLGIASFARGIPMLFLAPLAGVLVDRFDRSTVLAWGQGLTALVAFVLAGLIASGIIQPWHVVATAFVGGSLFVLIIPARQALVPSVVPRGQMGSAIALMSTGQNAGRVVGPALAGLSISLGGTAMSFTVQAIGFLLALLCSFGLGPQRARATSRSRSPAQDLLEGMRYVLRDPAVRPLMSLQAVPAFFIMPYSQLIPIFARDILHVGPEGLGALMTANGIGAIAGAAVMVFVSTRRQGWFLFLSLAAFGLSLTAFSISVWMPASIALMGLMGLSQAVYLATNNTLVQLATPDELRGRVMSLYMMTWGLMPLGSLPQGILADLFGAPIVGATAGLLAGAVVLYAAIRLPALRRM
ncbi:MAG: MFS transporter [Chloroflexota bacterium]